MCFSSDGHVNLNMACSFPQMVSIDSEVVFIRWTWKFKYGLLFSSDGFYWFRRGFSSDGHVNLNMACSFPQMVSIDSEVVFIRWTWKFKYGLFFSSDGFY